MDCESITALMDCESMTALKSVNMEKFAREKSLTLRVTISELVTDAHVQIAAFISVLSCSVEQQIIYMYFIC